MGHHNFQVMSRLDNRWQVHRAAQNMPQPIDALTAGCSDSVMVSSAMPRVRQPLSCCVAHSG